MSVQTNKHSVGTDAFVDRRLLRGFAFAADRRSGRWL